MSNTKGNHALALADTITSLLDELTGYSNASESSPLGKLIQITRKAARSIDPFVNIQAVMNYGIWHHFDHIGDEDGPAICPAELRQRYLHIFKSMMKLDTNFLDLLGELHKRPEKYLSEFMKNFIRHYGKARTEDMSSVQGKLIIYVQMAGYGQLTTSVRKQLGWNNEVSARMLCPHAKREEFDQNPQEFMAKLKNIAITLDTFDWATFLYNESLPYDPNEKDKGLFQGVFLVKIYTHLFCGPSVAINGLDAQITRSSKGDLIGLTSATPATIAYAICHCYYALTSSGNWHQSCLHVDLSQLFPAVLKLFEDDEQWSTEMISWWNKQLRFKAKSPSDEATAGTSNTSNLNDIRAQRAQRRNATVNNNCSPSSPAEGPVHPLPTENNRSPSSPAEGPVQPPPTENNHSPSSPAEGPGQPLPAPVPQNFSRESSLLSDPEHPDAPSTSNTNAATAPLTSNVQQSVSSAPSKKKSAGGRKRKANNQADQNVPPSATGSEARRSKRQRK